MKTTQEIVEEFKEKLKKWGLEDNDRETYLFVVEQYTQALQQQRTELLEELIKYDLYGEARALGIPMETVKKLQEALAPPLPDEDKTERV